MITDKFPNADKSFGDEAAFADSYDP